MKKKKKIPKKKVGSMSKGGGHWRVELEGLSHENSGGGGS